MLLAWGRVFTRIVRKVLVDPVFPIPQSDLPMLPSDVCMYILIASVVIPICIYLTLGQKIMTQNALLGSYSLYGIPSLSS